MEADLLKYENDDDSGCLLVVILVSYFPVPLIEAMLVLNMAMIGGNGV